MTETTATGQAATDSTGTTANAPGSVTSQAQTTGNGPAADANDSFFDPASIAGKPELEAAYKQMQGSYTKRMQEMSKHKTAIDAYTQFQSDPRGTLKRLGEALGLKVVEGPQDDSAQEQNFTSWDDVKKHFFSEFEKDKLAPLTREVQALKKQNIETYLDTHFTDWRTYESEMMDTLKTHPSLVQDPDKLYRLSVPEKIWEARATNRALERLKAATENGQVSGAGTVTKQTNQAPTGKLSFAQAAEYARQKLASQGLKAPSH